MFLRKFLPFFMLLFCLSCSNYNKVLKSSDYTLKQQKAMELYNKKDYQRAYPLFEELVSVKRGTADAEDLYYYYCYCNYYMDDLVSASYHFQQFALTYPSSPRAEEASYRNAYCYYLGSPDYSLDQTNSIKAIEEMQLFINQYPTSKYVEEFNGLIDKLRSKMERKAYETAKLYYKTYHYQAAIIALKNVIKEYPNTAYREEILFKIIKSNFLLAENSVDSKKFERYKNTIDAYYTFIDKFAAGNYASEARSIFEKASDRFNILKP